MQAVSVMLFLLALVCGVLALVSLITPRVAFFLKNKSRPKAALSFLGIGFVLMMTAGAIAPDLPQETLKAPTAQELSTAGTASVKTVGEQAKQNESETGKAEQQREAVEAKKSTEAKNPQAEKPVTALPYAIIKKEVNRGTSVKRSSLSAVVMPVGNQSEATAKDLAATLKGAATFLQKESGLPVVSVIMLSQKAASPFGEQQLGHVVYIPDGKGYTGKQKIGPWDNLRVAKRGFTAQELEYLRLWDEMRLEYKRKHGTAYEKPLEADIAKKMGIELGALNPHLNVALYNPDDDLSMSQPSNKDKDFDAFMKETGVKEPSAEEKKAEAARRQAYKRASLVAQKELRDIYNALVALNKSHDFHDVGFSANPRAAKARAWKARAEDFRDRMARSSDIAGEILIASPALIQLALELIRNPSAIDDMHNYSFETINDGLVWKMPAE